MNEVTIINLQKRSDRWAAISSNFNSYNIPFRRFEAVEHPQGALGCALSHVEVLKQYDGLSDAVCVAEDDAQVLHDVRSIIDDFMASAADVLLLGNNTRRTVPFSSTLSRAYDAYTTSFYVAKRESIPRLLACFKQAVEDLKTKRHQPIDVAWHGLQKELVFVVPKRRVVIQRAGYSDIEKKYVNYGV